MGGKSGGDYRAPVEAPNSLQSMQEVTIVEAVSEGPIVGLVTGDARSIALNETPLMTDEGTYTYQNVSWAIRNGTADQDAFDNIAGVESETSVGVEVTKDFPRASGSGSGAITRQITNPYCTDIRITMAVQALYEQLVDQDRAGDTVPMTISYTVLITDSQNAVVASDAVERTDKTTSGAQWAKKYRLSGTAPWTVTITKTYEDNTSDYKHNDIYWASYTEIIGYKMIYPNTACMMIRGNAETFGSSVPNRAYKIKGLIVEVPTNYNPETREYSGIWDGTFKNAWTDNPAWVLRDLLESGRYGLKKFFPPAKQGNPLSDKWTLYEIAKYCDELVSDGNGGMEPRYTFNGQIMGTGSASEVIQSIASNFHGMMYWGSGMAIAVADVPKDPIKSFTQANITNGLITYSTGSAQERHSVALVTWYDPDNYGNARIEPVYDWDAYQKYGYRAVNVTAYGCTSRAQAYRQGLWTLLTEDEQWQATCEVGLDGYDLMPGDFVKIADPHWMGTRFSGRIVSIVGAEVTLDGEVTFLAGESYVLYVMMPDGTEEHRNIANGAGMYSTVTIESAFDQTPVDYAVWTISGTDVAPRLFAVRAINEQENGRVQLDLREVMSSKYERLEQSFAFTVTPGRRPTIGVLAAPTGLTVVPANYFDNGQVLQRLTFSWTGSGDSSISEYEFGYKSPAGDWNSFTPKKTFSMDVAAAASGTYLFRVRALSLDGRQSAWAEKSYTLQGVTTVPKPPTGLTAEGGFSSIKVSWQMPSDVLIGYFEILMADSDNVEDAELVGKIYGSSFDVMGLGVMETKWFWVRSVSYAADAVKSEAIGPVSATTKALEMADIPDQSIRPSKFIPQLEALVEEVKAISAASIINSVNEDENRNTAAKATQDLETKVVEGLEAEATARTQLAAKVGENSAAIQITASAVATVDDKVEATYSIVMDANGRIAGVKLGSDGETSEMVFLANAFYFANPVDGGEPIQIFAIDATSGTPKLVMNGNLFVNAAKGAGGGWIVGNMISAAAQIQIGAGGSLIMGNGSIFQMGSGAVLIDSEAAVLQLKDPNNLTSGDYIRMELGDITTYKYINGAYRPMKSLRRIETGVASNGVTTELPGYWPSLPKIIVSPRTLQSYNAGAAAQSQQLVIYPDNIQRNSSGVVTFVPRAYIEIASGSGSVNSPAAAVNSSIRNATLPITLQTGAYNLPANAKNIAVVAKVYAQKYGYADYPGGVAVLKYRNLTATIYAVYNGTTYTVGTVSIAGNNQNISSEPVSLYYALNLTIPGGLASAANIYLYATVNDAGSYNTFSYNGVSADDSDYAWLKMESLSWSYSANTQLAAGSLNWVAISE